MDFHSLARKELQFLCKNNKIPANMTNVAMADALAALQHVEGIEELLNPSESESQRSPERLAIGSISRPACRTSTRRKPIKEELQTTVPLTRTRTHRGTSVNTRGGTNQENKDLNLPITPALPSIRRRLPESSACKKLDSQMMEEEDGENNANEDQEKNDAPKTPAVPKSQRKAIGAQQSSVPHVYSTRRSVRFLEKTMEKLSLIENEKPELLKVDQLSEEVHQGLHDQSITDMEPVKTNSLELLSESEVQNDVAERKKIDECEADDSKENLNLISEGGIEDHRDGADVISPKKMEATHTDAIDKAALDSVPAIVQSEAESEKETLILGNNEASAIGMSNVAAGQSSVLPENVILGHSTNDEEAAQKDDGSHAESESIDSEDIADIESEFPAADKPEVQDEIMMTTEKKEASLISENSLSETVKYPAEDLVDIDVTANEFHTLLKEETSKSEKRIISNDHSLYSEPKTKEIISESDTLVNVSVKLAEEFSMASDHLNVKNQTNGGISQISFAADKVAGQFPRPTCKVSTKQPTQILKMDDPLDDDEEDGSKGGDGVVVELKKTTIEEDYLSLRKLRKMVKELHLNKKSTKDKIFGKQQEVEKVRTALLPLQENCMATDEQGNKTNSTFF